MATMTVMPRQQGATPPSVRAIQVGLSVGIFTLIMSLIGLIIALNERDVVSGIISSGQAILLVLMMVAGYFAARIALSDGQSTGGAIAFGALAGVSASSILALLVIVGRVLDINLRAVLINAEPALYDLLTFEQENVWVGVAMLLAAGAAGGALGALLYVMPDRYRSAVTNGLGAVLVIGLLQDFTELIVKGLGDDAVDFFFGRSGLTTAGAVVVFLIPFLLRLVQGAAGNQINRQVNELPTNTRRLVSWIGFAIIAFFLLAFPQIFGNFSTEIANTTILTGVMVGLGLNIVVGFAGLLDLGYVGFFAIGAYTMGLLTSPEMAGVVVQETWTFWQALPVAILISLLAGVILGVPVLKMRGDYLAIVTLGFGEIIRLLFLSNWLKGIVNGAQGITLIPKPMIGATALISPTQLYYLLLVAVLITVVISIRLRDSRIGRAWLALREDEDVAEAMGIDLVATKLLAFGTGAAIAGFGGAIFAAKLGSIVPQTFGLLISVNALAVIIIGGLGSIPGVIVGAILLIGVPELLREFAEYRLWAYGVLLIMMMLFRPEGFIPSEITRRELHAHEEMPNQVAEVPFEEYDVKNETVTHEEHPVPGDVVVHEDRPTQDITGIKGV